MKKIFIGCDDSGYALKQSIMSLLQELSIPYEDCGSEDVPSRYPYYAARVASAVSKGVAERGILICGSGIGMSIAANKFPGVRAALVTDTYGARLTRRHNDSNVLCLGGETLGRWTALEIVRVWLDTEYDGGHHEDSLRLIREMEAAMMNEACWCPEQIPYEEFCWNPDQKL